MTELEMMEAQKVTQKELVAKRDMALKLANNREFRKLILEEFCVNECARYAQSSADPALQQNERDDSLALSQAAGHLRRWLNVVVTMGNTAENNINELDQAIEEIRTSGVDEVEA